MALVDLVEVWPVCIFRRRPGRQNQVSQAHKAHTGVSGGDVLHPPASSAPSPTLGEKCASTRSGPASSWGLSPISIGGEGPASDGRLRAEPGGWSHWPGGAGALV